MKTFYFLILLLISQNIFAQEKYIFDYLIEYEKTENITDSVVTPQSIISPILKIIPTPQLLV